MTVDLGLALLVGCLGGVLMLAVGSAARSTAARLDVAMMWARLLGFPTGAGYAAGLVLHFAVSGVVGALYALGFRLAEATDAGLLWGVVASVLHWLIAGAFLALRRGDNPTEGSRPAAFGADLGPVVAVGFLVAHIVFGAVFGVAYFTLHAEGGVAAAL